MHINIECYPISLPAFYSYQIPCAYVVLLILRTLSVYEFFNDHVQ